MRSAASRGSLSTAVVEDLDGRVQLFDRAAANVAGRIAASRQRAGRTVEIRDVQIAGITSARKATLATRNVRHFEGPGHPPRRSLGFVLQYLGGDSSVGAKARRR